MFLQIRRLFCIHAFEYEIGADSSVTKVCRKCGAYHR